MLCTTLLLMATISWTNEKSYPLATLPELRIEIQSRTIPRRKIYIGALFTGKVLMSENDTEGAYLYEYQHFLAGHDCGIVEHKCSGAHIEHFHINKDYPTTPYCYYDPELGWVSTDSIDSELMTQYSDREVAGQSLAFGSVVIDPLYDLYVPNYDHASLRYLYRITASCIDYASMYGNCHVYGLQCLGIASFNNTLIPDAQRPAVFGHLCDYQGTFRAIEPFSLMCESYHTNFVLRCTAGIQINALSFKNTLYGAVYKFEYDEGRVTHEPFHSGTVEYYTKREFVND